MTATYNRGPIPGKIQDLPTYLRKELDKISLAIAGSSTTTVSGWVLRDFGVEYLAVDGGLADVTLVDTGTGEFTPIAASSVTPSEQQEALTDTKSEVLAQAQFGTANGTAVTWSFTPSAALGRSGWTLSASATGGGTSLAAAIDFDATTRWSTGAVVVPGTSYFRVDAGAAVSVGCVRMDDSSFTGDIPATGDIQYSDNGTGWTTIASWTLADVTNGVLTKSFTAQSHRYWQLLAQSTPTVSTNWWSIGEFYLYPTTPTDTISEPADQTWGLLPGATVRLSGLLKKGATSDLVGVRIGLDATDWYGLEWGSSSTSLLLLKEVAGTKTTLQTLTFDSDTEVHHFQLVVGAAATNGADNWIALTATRTANPPASGGAHDSTLNLTTGTGNFLLRAPGPTSVRGCVYTLA